MFRSAVLALLATAGANAQADDTVIRSGVAWFDTAGNRIYAGGANIYFENGTYVSTRSMRYIRTTQKMILFALPYPPVSRR